MKNTLKFLGISFALVLLVMSQQVYSAPVEAAIVAENDVQWASTGVGTGVPNAATKGTKVKYYTPTDVANFYIRDADLNSVIKGLTKYTCASGGTVVGDNVPLGLVAAASEPVGGCTATEHLDNAAMSDSSVYGSGAGPADTPIVNGTLMFKKGGAVLAVDTIDESAGTALTNGAVSGGFAATDSTIGKAFYTFNTQQTYSNAVGTSDLNGLRAKVTSTSDSTGE